MKKTLKVVLVGLLLVTMASMAFAAGKAEPKTDGKMVFRMSHVFLPEQPLHIALADVAKKINERTNGQIEIAIYPDGQIANGVDGAEQLRRGSLFINVYDPSCMGDWVPDYYALIGPMLYNDMDEYSAICQTELAKSMNRKAETQGFKVLALDYNFGMRNMVTTERKGQIKSIQDIQGLKMRVPKSNLWIDTFTTLGAAPVGMAWAEVYNALQQGVVDGLETSISDIYDNSLNEVAKYVTITAHFVATGAVALSKEVWDKFTPQQQQIFQEEFTRGAVYNNDLVRKLEAESQKILESRGMVFNTIDVTPFRQKAKAWFDNNKDITPGVYNAITAELDKIRKK